MITKLGEVFFTSPLSHFFEIQLKAIEGECNASDGIGQNGCVN